MSSLHHGNGAYFFEISPTQKHLKKFEDSVQEDIPILRLTQFTHNPKVSFGTVRLNDRKESILRILNPKDELQEVYCERFPAEDKGFTIDPKQLTLKPAETKEVVLSWTPQNEGGVRELIHWKTSLGVRAQTVLLGTCIEVSRKKKSGRPRHCVTQPLQSHNAVPSSGTDNTKKSSKEWYLRYPGRRDQENKPPLCVTSSVKEFGTSESYFQTQSEISYIANQVAYPSTFSISGVSSIGSNNACESPGNNMAFDWRKEGKKLPVFTSHWPRRDKFIEEDTGFQRRSRDGHFEVTTSECHSPIRRQTFIKSDGSDREVPETLRKSEVLATISETKEKITKGNDQATAKKFSSDRVPNSMKEDTFVDSKRDFSECEIIASPLRRQTYIKSHWSEQDPLTELVEEVEEDPLTESVEVDNAEDKPYFIQHGLSDLAQTPAFSNATLKDNVRLSCLDLIGKLDILFEPSIREELGIAKVDCQATSISSPHTKNSKMVRTNSCDSVISNSELMYTAPTTPTTFVTAPSTPVELDYMTLLDEDAENDLTQNFLTPLFRETALQSLDEITLDFSANDNTLIASHLTDYEMFVANNVRNCETLTSFPKICDRDVSHLCESEHSIMEGFPEQQVKDDFLRNDYNDTINATVDYIQSEMCNESISYTPSHESFSIRPLPSKSMYQSLLASPLEFTFLPSDDPKKCSTGMKCRSGADGSQLFAETTIAGAAYPLKNLNFCILDAENYLCPNETLSVDDMKPISDHCTEDVSRCDSTVKAPLKADQSPEEGGTTTEPREGLALIFSPPPRQPQVSPWERRNRVSPKVAAKISAHFLKPSIRGKSRSISDRKCTQSKSVLDSGVEDNEMSVVISSSASLDSDIRSRKNASHSLSNFNFGSAKDIRKPGIRKKPRIPKTRLRLYKSAAIKSSAVIHHPNPFAAKNMYYDDRWIEKQMSGFTKWLNFVLTPPEEENTASRTDKVNVTKLWMEVSRCSNMLKAPSRETISLTVYTAVKRWNCLRKAAFKLYQSPNMAEVITKVESMLERKLLVIRKDRQTHADIGLKQAILQLVLCYNSLWLRIGLETVYGEALMISSNRDITGLTHFLINRFVNCPDIAKSFAHPKVPHLHKPGFEEALKLFQLRKFLLLVYFLDRAKAVRLIDHDPCLFNKDAEIKSSRDILLAFARDFLSGVGDITKHLAYIGYSVSHQQSLLDEFEFAVTNLATDLRCGIRLTRVAETLIGDYSLSGQLRVPAVSRLQKVHNVEVALLALEENGVADLRTRCAAKDIVDGHREKTLGLLWELIFNFQIKSILSVPCLLAEIRHLRKSLIVRSCFDERAKKGLEMFAEDHATQQKDSSDSYTSEAIWYLLQLWAQLVCAHYNLQVNNMTVSFCDGRAFCFLLHFYHPELLKESDIFLDTTQTLELSESDNEGIFDLVSDDEMVERIANEKANFGLFLSKLSDLGAIPVLIRTNDMINTIPDEKVTTTFLAYLCARLLNLSTEIKAARTIQLAWKKKLAMNRLKLLKLQTAAVTIIQKWWRSCLLRKRAALFSKAALIVQSHWRRKQAYKTYLQLKYEKELKLMNERAATIQRAFRTFQFRSRISQAASAFKIQRAWRTYWQRQIFLLMRKSATKVQACVRMWMERRRYRRTLMTITSMQQKYKEKLLTKRIQREYLDTLKAILMLQVNFRGFLARQKMKKLKRERDASLILSNFFRMVLARKRYLKYVSAAIVIQKNIRSKVECAKYRRLRYSAIVIQRYWKNFLVSNKTREEFLYLRCQTIAIQSYFRQYRQRKKFMKTKEAAIVIQSHIRGWKDQHVYNAKKRSACIVQCWWRSILLMKKDQHMLAVAKSSVIIIQSHVRSWKARRLYATKKMATCIIQRWWRSVLLMKEDQKMLAVAKSSASLIQSHIRSWKARRLYATKKMATCIIQRWWRGVLLMKEDQKMLAVAKSSATLIQSHIRSWKARRLYATKKMATCIIQRWWRRVLLMKEDQKMLAVAKSSATLIQSHIRSWKARRLYATKKMATCIIQRWWRGVLLMKEDQKMLAVAKSSATLIQSHIRSWKARRLYATKKMATCIIQGWWRGVLLMKEDQKMLAVAKSSVTLIQSHVRSWKARRLYATKKMATCIIQRWWRGVLLMKEDQKMLSVAKSSAILIQSHIRSWKARRLYATKKMATCIIQRWWRGVLLMKEDQKMLSVAKSSAILIQSHIRSWKARRLYATKKMATCIIQRWWRSVLLMKEDQKMLAVAKSSASLIQSHIRSWKARRLYATKKMATCIIQRWWRGVLLMKEDQKMLAVAKSSATLIQSHIRSWKARRLYATKKMATCIIQRWWRSVLLMKEDQKMLAVAKSSATLIQSHIRSWKARRLYATKKMATCIIQRWWRGVLLMKEDQKMLAVAKSSATLIQSHIRSWKARRLYATKKMATCIIQGWWRSVLLMKEDQKMLAVAKSSVTLIQSHVRSWKARRLYATKKMATCIIQRWWRGVLLMKEDQKMLSVAKSSAILIQSHIRSWKARRLYATKKMATCIIQRWWRGVLLMKEDQKMLSVAKSSAILIQSHIRSWKARRLYATKKMATCIIQRWWRSVLLMKEYQKMLAVAKSSVTLIQSHVRSWKARQLYATKKMAACIIQGWWRSVMLMKEDQKMLAVAKFSATLIQSHVKGWKARRLYSAQKKATCIIQRWWRSVLLMEEDQKMLAVAKSSVIIIQSHVKSWKARRLYATKKMATCIIQGWWRSVMLMKEDQKMLAVAKSSATLIQSHIRSWKARRLYATKKMATCIIQRWWRSVLLMKEDQKMLAVAKSSVIIIQSHVKSWKARRLYATKKMATCIIQGWWRSVMLMKEDQKMLAVAKSSAILIQSHVRSWKARRLYATKKMATCIIQGWWRSVLQMRKDIVHLSLAKSSAITIQATFRCWILKRRYNREKIAAVVIQVWWRSICSLRILSALKIQTAFRSWRDRRLFLIKRDAICKIQAWWRNVMQMRQDRTHFQAMKKSASTIQSYWKRLICRKILLERWKAAVLIQSTFHMIQQRRIYCKEREACIMIQAFWRMCQVRKEYLTKRKACVIIQSHFRRLTVQKEWKKKKDSAILIQTCYRNHLLKKSCRENYIDTRKKIILLQALCRGYRARRRYGVLRHSAVVIQSVCRGFLVRKRLQIEHEAVLTIESFYLACLQVRKAHRAACCIQAAFRGHLERQKLRLAVSAAVVIQSFVRMSLRRRKYINLVGAAKVLQCHWRAICLMKEQREKYRICRGAAILLQSVWRGVSERKTYNVTRHSAIQIQAWYRGKLCRRRLQLQMQSIMLIQRWWRGQVLTLNLQEEYQMKRQAALTIQRYFRVWKMMRGVEIAAKVIQTAWRSCRDKRCYQQVKTSAVIIQKWWRSHQEAKKIRCQYLYLQGCLIMIQAYCRGSIARKAFQSACKDRILMRNGAAMVIQTWWRTRKMMREARHHFIILRSSAVIIQSVWKGKKQRRSYQRFKTEVEMRRLAYEHSRALYLKRFVKIAEYHLAAMVLQRTFRYRRYCKERRPFAIVIQRAVRTFIQRRRFIKLREAVIGFQRASKSALTRRRRNKEETSATRIQANWRGYKLRQKMLSNRRMTIIRERLCDATAKACEGKQIGQRTALAVNYLMHFKDMKRILIAVINLESSTKWSSTSCEKLMSHNGLNMLIQLINSCNRSVPHMEILGHVLNTLINLAKCSQVVDCLRENENLVKSVITLIKVYREKGPSLFNKGCSLLYILASLNPPNKTVYTAEVKMNVNSLCSLLERKLKLGKDKNASCKRAILPPSKCPSLSPEWSMRPSEVREFSDSFVAIITLKAKINNEPT